MLSLKTALSRGVPSMYRTALPGALLGAVALTLAACSLSKPPVMAGLADDTPAITPAASRPRPATTTGALGGDPGAPRPDAGTATKVARLDDKAPAGTYEKATKGALSDRDYSHTSLDAERARDIINQYRIDHKLKPLRLNAELTAAAKMHSRDLAKWDRISHYGSDGSTPWDRAKRSGYKPRVAAENVGTGQVSFEEVMRGWKDSPGHNKNLLMPEVEHMGIALVQDPKTEFKSYWTLVLGAQM
jgi:uncharacterized protein YkwD